jgi:transposase-like protein
MKNPRDKRIALTPAQRGQIVQRVLVDGWTSAEAAAAAAVPERLVEAWVADYRRHGMASLRRASSKTVATEIVRVRLVWPFRAVSHGISSGVRWLLARERPVPPSPLRHSRDDRRGGGA